MIVTDHMLHCHHGGSFLGSVLLVVPPFILYMVWCNWAWKRTRVPKGLSQ